MTLLLAGMFLGALFARWVYRSQVRALAHKHHQDLSTLHDTQVQELMLVSKQHAEALQALSRTLNHVCDTSAEIGQKALDMYKATELDRALAMDSIKRAARTKELVHKLLSDRGIDPWFLLAAIDEEENNVGYPAGTPGAPQ